MKEKILEGALSVFKVKGLKFTMDDLALELHISKKTIYTIFDDKNQLLCDVVDYAFDLIKDAEDKIYNDDSLSTIEKIRGVLSVLPDSYAGFDFRTLYQFKDKYPRAYALLSERLDSGWDKTRELFDRGVKEGVVKDINFEIFQLTYEAAIEKLLISDVLEKKSLDYKDAFEEVVNILVEGVIK